MKIILAMIAIISAIAIAGSAYAISCPLCSGKVIEFCDVTITPAQRMYNQEIKINVSLVYMEKSKPIEVGTIVEIDYYDKKNNLTKLEYKTGDTGIISFVPRIPGYHIVKACKKSLLFYVNTSCGDGACGDAEDSVSCPIDCFRCGDWVCSPGEGVECADCSVCGDGVCSAGETRGNCVKDCLVCGDGICDYLESACSCKKDCAFGSADNCCDGKADERCDPDCAPGKDPDCRANATKIWPDAIAISGGANDKSLIYACAAAIIVIMAIVIRASFVKRPKKN